MAQLKLWYSVWIGINSLHLLTHSFTQSVSFFTDLQLLQLFSSNFFLQGWSLVHVVESPSSQVQNKTSDASWESFHKYEIGSKEIILIYVLLFWPGSIMICLYVVFFNNPSVQAGSRIKLNWKTGWHNTMQTSYQLSFTSCRNVDPYGHSLHIALYLHVIQSWSINFRTWMYKTKSIYLDPRSTYCIIIEQMSFILPFMHLAVVLRKVFLLINQCSLFSVLGSPCWFAPPIHANLDPVRKTFQSTELQKKSSSSVSIQVSCKGTYLSIKVAFLRSLPCHITVFL